MITLRARKNVTLSVTQQQHDILIGCILGDAYIEKKGKIQIEQSAKQKLYIDWKYEKLESISYGKPSEVVRFDKRYNTHYHSYRFWTRQFFRYLRDQFYEGNKKIFSKNLEKLSPLSMAVWYMDDGCLNEGKRIVLSTDSFSDECLERVQQVLLNSFDVRCSLKQTGKILIGTKYSRKIFAEIQPFVISSMQYKLP